MLCRGLSVYETALWSVSSPLLLSRADGNGGPHGLIYHCCEMYLDDCIVHGKGEAEFLTNLNKVFERFRLKGLRLKAKKCRFSLPCIEYVGRVVDKDGLSMSKEKIETVLNFSILKNLTLLRSFLGLANYFRQFVPMHSTLVKPMQDMIDVLEKILYRVHKHQ